MAESKFRVTLRPPKAPALSNDVDGKTLMFYGWLLQYSVVCLFWRTAKRARVNYGFYTGEQQVGFAKTKFLRTDLNATGQWAS